MPSGLVSRRLDLGGSSEAVVPISRHPRADEQLAAALLANEPDAVAELFDRFHGVVRKMLVRTLGSAHDVEDLSQETFLIVLRRVGTLRDPTQLASFVIGAAIRVAKNELRKRAFRRWIGLEDSPASVPPVDVDLKEGVTRLYRALERLDASSRVLFVLRHVEEVELTELSSMLGLSLSTVKRRLVQAERRFEALARHDPILCSYLEGKR